VKILAAGMLAMGVEVYDAVGCGTADIAEINPSKVETSSHLIGYTPDSAHYLLIIRLLRYSSFPSLNSNPPHS
jgi:hypothetical protein